MAELTDKEINQIIRNYIKRWLENDEKERLTKKPLNDDTLYGVVINNGKKTKELSGGYRLTTNNRMELMACIVGLGSLKKGTSVIPLRFNSLLRYRKYT